MTENPMVVDSFWDKPKPRFRKVYDDDYDEIYIIDEQGREVDPGLLCEQEED